ncbi:hypothetical protein DH2020_015883 [Rehmannia glutinosa]|uniref:Uncharacterized protein n=1 Tax=Rehmannia glutinosa TaxID=99300 RepID=A0ABR0WUF6_REHGL
MFITDTMEQSSFGSKRHDEPDFNLKEWALKARISRENTSSRRFSASNLKSFREDEKSFRSNITISSTASSPGYTIRDEIDPSTYSFTTALKALQAKTVYTWEYLSPDGLTLNSKWSDAEKYICNPLSGEVPLECLSSKTLSEGSFRSLTSRITMSAPLIYPSHFQPKSPIIQHHNQVNITIQENKRSITRDVGTQSTPNDLSSNISTPAPPPSLEEKSMKLIEAQAGDSIGKLKSEAKQQVEVKETREKQSTKRNEGRERVGSGGGGGCLSLRNLWRHRPRNNKNNPTSPTFLYHVNASYKQ